MKKNPLVSQKPNISFCFSTHFTKLKDHSALRHKDHQTRLPKETYSSNCLILTWAVSDHILSALLPSNRMNTAPETQICWIIPATHSAYTELPVWKLHYCILVPATTQVLILSLQSQLENHANDQGDNRLLLLATAKEIRQLHNLPASVPWKAQCPKYFFKFSC